MLNYNQWIPQWEKKMTLYFEGWITGMLLALCRGFPCIILTLTTSVNFCMSTIPTSKTLSFVCVLQNCVVLRGGRLYCYFDKLCERTHCKYSSGLSISYLQLSVRQTFWTYPSTPFSKLRVCMQAVSEQFPRPCGVSGIFQDVQDWQHFSSLVSSLHLCVADRCSSAA